MTKTIAIILAAVLVVGGGVTAGVVVSNNNLPENVVKDAILDLANFVEREEFAPLYQTITNGSIEITQTYIRQDGKITENNNSAKLFFADDGIVLQNINFAQLGINGDLWLTEDFVYVKEENLLGGAYALEMGQLAEQFQKSIFAFGCESKYAIADQETFDDIVQFLEYVDKVNTRKMEKDLTKIVKNYLKEFWEIACEQVDFNQEVRVVKIDGESVEARNVQIIVDADDVCKIWEEILDFLQEDEQVTKFLDKNEDLLNVANNPIFSTTSTDKTLADNYRTALNELEKEFYNTAAQIQDEWGDDLLVIDVATPKHKSQLLKLNVNYGGDDQLTLDFGGKTIQDANKITLVEEGVKQIYKVTNGDQKLKISYTIDECEVLKFDLDKETTNYELHYSEYYSYQDEDALQNSITLKGKIIDGADLTITVNEVISKEYNIWWENPMEYSYTTDLKFVLKNKDKLPEKPTDYKTLETLTEEDVDKLLGYVAE